MGSVAPRHERDTQAPCYASLVSIVFLGATLAISNSTSRRLGAWAYGVFMVCTLASTVIAPSHYATLFSGAALLATAVFVASWRGSDSP